MIKRDNSNAGASANASTNVHAERLPWVILNAQDTDRLLRLLYNDRKPARVHTLFCVCGLSADRRGNPDAWNGWRVLPHPKCPGCLAREGQPHLARERFSRMVSMLSSGELLPGKDG